MAEMELDDNHPPLFHTRLDEVTGCRDFSRGEGMSSLATLRIEGVSAIIPPVRQRGVVNFPGERGGVVNYSPGQATGCRESFPRSGNSDRLSDSRQSVRNVSLLHTHGGCPQLQHHISGGRDISSISRILESFSTRAYCRCHASSENKFFESNSSRASSVRL